MRTFNREALSSKFRISPNRETNDSPCNDRVVYENFINKSQRMRNRKGSHSNVNEKKQLRNEINIETSSFQLFDLNKRSTSPMAS